MKYGELKLEQRDVLRGLYFIIGLLIGAMLVTVVFAATDQTNGDFLLQLPKAIGLSAQGDIQGTRILLAAAGFDIPTLDWSDDLTQGAAVALAAAVGIKATTTAPDLPMNSKEVASFWRALRELEAPALPPSIEIVPSRSEVIP